MPNKFTADDRSDEQRFSDWMAGKSDSPEPLAVNESVPNKESILWQQRANTGQYLQHQITAPDHKVPHWDRGAAFSTDHRPWWQWQGLPVISMAFSMCAIALVLFKVELVIKDEGLLLSFAGNHAKQQSEQLSMTLATIMDNKLQAFENKQQLLLANYTLEQNSKQQQSNLQLASYVIGATRQERKEDLTDFIRYINEERKEERFEQTIKFEQLDQAIYQQLETSQAPTINWTSPE